MCMSNNCCHEGCGYGVDDEDKIRILEQTKKILQIRVESIDHRISQLKTQETQAGG